MSSLEAHGVNGGPDGVDGEVYCILQRHGVPDNRRRRADDLITAFFILDYYWDEDGTENIALPGPGSAIGKGAVGLGVSPSHLILGNMAGINVGHADLALFSVAGNVKTGVSCGKRFSETFNQLFRDRGYIVVSS